MEKISMVTDLSILTSLGERIEHVLWRVRDIAFPPRLRNVVILFGTNNINKDPPYELAQGLIAIGSSFKNRFDSPDIFICGLLPRDVYFSINRVIIADINDRLSFKCSVNNFHFIDQSNGWTLNNVTTLDFSLFYSHGQRLVQIGNVEPGKSILKATDPTITGSKIRNRYKKCSVLHRFQFEFRRFLRIASYCTCS